MMLSTMYKNKKSALKSALYSLSAAFFWIAVWQIVYFIVGSDVIVASPLSTLLRVIELSAGTSFWLSVLNSIGNILLGFLFSIVFAIILSAFCSRSEFLQRLFSPLIKLVRATPVASFIILAIFWLSTDAVPTFISFLMVFPLVFTNLSEGFKGVDKNLLEMAEVYRFDFFKKVRLIYIPSLMPYFVSACSVGLGFAFKSGIAAEVIAQSKNTLGLAIYDAKVYIETVDVFALTCVIIILSILLEKAFMFLIKSISDKVLKGGAK